MGGGAARLNVRLLGPKAPQELPSADFCEIVVSLLLVTAYHQLFRASEQA